ncbi:hypothetical protein IF2G_04208 [Cordyceps javanica]|nr:hypothetical protein IF2G_04208 [Cordyceps javanica]
MSRIKNSTENLQAEKQRRLPLAGQRDQQQSQTRRKPPHWRRCCPPPFPRNIGLSSGCEVRGGLEGGLPHSSTRCKPAMRGRRPSQYKKTGTRRCAVCD